MPTDRLAYRLWEWGIGWQAHRQSYDGLRGAGRYTLRSSINFTWLVALYLLYNFFKLFEPFSYIILIFIYNT